MNQKSKILQYNFDVFREFWSKHVTEMIKNMQKTTSSS
jgi:hypothetical protein